MGGQIVEFGIIPNNEEDYPTHYDKFGKGGMRSVNTIAQRDAIPLSRLTNGCQCYVAENKTSYHAVINVYKEGTYDEVTTFVKWEKDATQDKVDEIYEGDKPVATPLFSQITIALLENSEGASVPLSQVGLVTSQKEIILEYGYRIVRQFKYSWNSNENFKDPTLIDPTSITNVLTASGILSALISTNELSNDHVISIKLGAPKRGLEVQGSKVVPASGNDYSVATMSTTFKHRLFYGKNAGSATITGLSDELVKSRGKTFSAISCTPQENFVFAYPVSLGKLTSIIQDGAQPILGAFNLQTVNIINDALLSIPYYFYISNNKGAFTNVELKFI